MKKLSKIICLVLCVSMLASCGRPSAEDKTTPGQEGSDEQGMMTADYDGHEAEAEATSGNLWDSSRLDDYVADYVSVNDADPGLKISVLAPAGYSTDDVLAGMRLSNFSNPLLTDPEQTDLIEPDYLVAEGGAGEFQIGCIDGFNKGNVYQIELIDPDLTYKGEETEVRYYNITVMAEDNDRMSLNSDVQFLATGDISGEDAAHALRLDGLFRVSSDMEVQASNEGSGSFLYDEGAYNIGDIVAIYEGVRPDERALNDTEDGVAYVEIKGITPAAGGQSEYYYEGAHQEDVLFTPDVIPVHQEIRLTSGQESSITLASSDLQFSSDGSLVEMGLDENTHVDIGDYLAFYTGSMEDGEVTAYAEVTGISFTEENGIDETTVEYRAVTLEEMMRSIDCFHRSEFSDEQVSAAYDEEAIKAGVIDDLTNNGYLVESTYSLAELALETDEAKDYFGDTAIEDLTFYFGENEENSLSGREYLAIANGQAANGVEIKGSTDVMASPNIVHFAGKTGYGIGVRVEVNAKYTVTIKSDSVRAALRVTPVFFFETEVVFGATGDASAVWKWKWIFPYIYDYNVSGSVGAGIYVGVGFTTSATLIDTEKMGDDEEIAGIPWPDGVDQTAGTTKVVEIANYVKEKGKAHDQIFPQQTTGGGTLAQKYAAFCYGASNSWVDLIEKNIFDLNFSIFPFHIFAMRVKADFVVSAQLNAALGFGGNYERAYKNTFSFLLFRQESTGNSTEDTDSSTFRADVYIFGALGIRAGIRLSIGVGFLDARLDSVGFDLEAGLYARFWGFFYAGVEILNVGKANKSVDSYYEGGMLMEAGAYFKVTFVAQLGDGSIAYKKILLEYEKPFFGIGTDSIITDFKYDYGVNDFAAEFTKDNNTAKISDDVFMMTSMSIKDGTINDTDRSKGNATELYDISFDDPDFSYVYENGSHYIRRNNDKGGEGQVRMTLKWRGTSFEQMSHVLQRIIEITWVSQMTSMKFLNKDGSIFFIVARPADSKLGADDLPQKDPEAYGYIFQGWLDSNGNRLEAFPDVMPSEDTVYTSDWVGAPASVVVQYYAPNGRDQYDLYKFDVMASDTIDDLFVTGDKVDNILDILREHNLLRTEESFSGEGMTFTDHYEINMIPSVVSTDFVSYDGTTVFEIWLNYTVYTVTFDNGDGTSQSFRYTIEHSIEFPQVTRGGYTFVGWQDEDGKIVNTEEKHMCTGDAVYTAIWEKLPPAVTVIAQVKVQSWGATYYWNTIKQQELILDSYEVTVQELIDLIDMGSYEYLSASSGRELTDVVEVAEDGSTQVILRFKE